MNPVVLKCLVGAGAVAGATGGGVGAVYLGGGFKGLFKSKEKLEIEKLKEFGIPERCWQGKEIKKENIKQCNLTAEDLSKIKFLGFPKEGNSEVTELWVGGGKKNWSRNQVITLTFRDGKYIFENYFQGPRNSQSVHRAITITRGSASVTLDGNMDSEFTVEEDGLKKEEFTELGFPKRCEIGDEKSKICELSENEIKRLKLKKTGVSPDLLYGNVKGNKKMKLTIEETEEATYKDKKKYILEFKGDISLMIYDTIDLKEGVEVQASRTAKTLIFSKGQGKTFKNEDNSLVLVK